MSIDLTFISLRFDYGFTDITLFARFSNPHVRQVLDFIFK